MKKYLWVCWSIMFIAMIGLAMATNNKGSEEILGLIPWPSEVKRGAGEYALDAQSRLISSSAAMDVAEMLKANLTDRFGIELPIDPSEELEEFILLIRNPASPSAPKPLPPEGKESYEIVVTPDGLILTAHDRAGLYWGTRTILQLLKRKNKILVLPAVEIKDRPRFERRSLLVDPARTFISFSYLKRIVNLLADHKYNVLHLHFTDDQGWRFESKVHQRLHLEGGNGIYYSQTQLRKLVAYAAKRGIEVLPEIDMPGHATAMIAAYPELSCSGKEIEVARHFGILPAALCPAKEEVYEFIEDIIRESADIFPSEFIHIGSDEVLAYEWKRCPKCKKLMA